MRFFHLPQNYFYIFKCRFCVFYNLFLYRSATLNAGKQFESSYSSRYLCLQFLQKLIIHQYERTYPKARTILWGQPH